MQLCIEPGGTSEQLEALRTGRCDIGFITHTRDVSPFAWEEVSNEPLMVLLPSGHRLTRRSSPRTRLSPERPRMSAPPRSNLLGTNISTPSRTYWTHRMLPLPCLLMRSRFSGPPTCGLLITRGTLAQMRLLTVLAPMEQFITSRGLDCTVLRSPRFSGREPTGHDIGSAN